MHVEYPTHGDVSMQGGHPLHGGASYQEGPLAWFLDYIGELNAKIERTEQQQD